MPMTDLLPRNACILLDERKVAADIIADDSASLICASMMPREMRRLATRQAARMRCGDIYWSRRGTGHRNV